MGIATRAKTGCGVQSSAAGRNLCRRHISLRTCTGRTPWSMDAIFGQMAEPELYSPKNGLLISFTIERFFEYKLRIIDPTWQMLSKNICPNLPIKWNDLDDKRLQFRTEFRPRARYLYFHYCVQVLLRHARQQDSESAARTLKDERGKPVWGTAGRYINKKC
jgi:hypothetical protein